MDGTTTTQHSSSISSSTVVPSSSPTKEDSLCTQSTASTLPTSQPSNPRLTALEAKRLNLESTLQDLQAERSVLLADNFRSKSSSSATKDHMSEEDAVKEANATVRKQISLLTKYNEIKDVAQVLMGLIAEQRGVRVGEVMEEFGVNEKD